MFTWQSGSASDKFNLTDVSSKSFENYKQFNTEMTGVVLDQKLNGIPFQYCIAAKKSNNVHVSYNCQFYPNKEKSGKMLWKDLESDGKLNNQQCININIEYLHVIYI